ncbi:MAG: gamma-glutamylcyclotransferase [Magnetospirillum sp.]|nr:gamma-glutamylcyclotransferase [Magnetospirillum sp.]
MRSARPEGNSTCTPRAGWRQGTDLWVFAYGSLMWRPDFEAQEVASARLMGYHRAFCILSSHYRGTPERPGLVLGLDRGGSCRGRALLVAAPLVPEVMDRLYRREMVTGVYAPRFVPVTLEDGRRVSAWTFLARRDHPQYFADRDNAALAALIRQGSGEAGPCREYLANTIAQLEALGLGCGGLRRLLALVDGKMPKFSRNPA